MKIADIPAGHRRLLRHAVSLLILGAVIVFYVKKIDFRQVLTLLPRSDWTVLLVGYLLTVMVFAVRGFRWSRVVENFDFHLSYPDAILMNFVEIFFSNFVSALSPLVRAMYLGKRVRGTSERLRLLFLDKMFDWLIPLSIACVALPYLLFNLHPEIRWVALIVVLIILPLAVHGGLHVLSRLMSQQWPRRIENLRMRLISPLRGQPLRLRWQALVTWYSFSLLGFALYYASIYSIAHSFLLRVEFVELVMIDAAATLSVLIPLNFAGISTRDLALAGLLVWKGSPEESVSLFALSIIILRFLLSGLGWVSMGILRWRGYHLITNK